MTTMYALATDQLDFSYSNSSDFVFRSMTLAMPRGAATAILGPNGSGKTTLLDLFLGLLTPTGGSLSILGQNRRAYSSKAIKQVLGLVPQNEIVPFELTLLEYVLLGRAPFLGLLQTPGKDDRGKAIEAIDQVGMAHMQNRPVPFMSGGERQLAAVARALAQESQILLMDEPTSHLDLANARRILRLIRKIAEQGRTVVFTTHDPNAAAAVANHIVLLKHQQLLASGPTVETLTRPLLSATYDETIEVVETQRGLFVLTYDDPDGREQPYDAVTALKMHIMRDN
jgi:iron complex transport system ATP-binding protein